MSDSTLTYQAVGLGQLSAEPKNGSFTPAIASCLSTTRMADFLYDVRQYGPLLGATYRF